MMVHEIILAIDPYLQRIEEILLWKNLYITSIIFTTCNISFWLLYSYNIRTYATLSFSALILHLLDCYRQKMKKKLRKQNSKVGSIIGKYFLNAYDKGTLLFQRIFKMRKENPFKYFFGSLVMCLILIIIGIKIKGFYLAYFTFWILFFIPAIIHYNVPSKLLSKAVPVLEQLDRSMEYERRSILDKKNLLVDVKLPQNELDNEEDDDDDDYIKSFKLDKIRMSKIESCEDDDEDETTSASFSAQGAEESQSEFDEQEEEENDDVDDEDEVKVTEEIIEYYETIPQAKEKNDTSNDHESDPNIQQRIKKTTKTRPSLFDYYPNVTKESEQNDNPSNDDQLDSTISSTQLEFSDSMISNILNSSTASSFTSQLLPSQFDNIVSQNDKDIDDTFDFLDEELVKIKHQESSL